MQPSEVPLDVLTEARGCCGSVQVLGSTEHALIVVQASGFITPHLLREDLKAAREFGEAHSDGWHYVVDTRRVRLIHPMNPLLLRQIPRLPNIRSYVTIASFPLRLFLTLGRRIVGADCVVPTAAAALSFLKLRSRNSTDAPARWEGLICLVLAAPSP